MPFFKQVKIGLWYGQNLLMKFLAQSPPQKAISPAKFFTISVTVTFMQISGCRP